MATQGNHW